MILFCNLTPDGTDLVYILLRTLKSCEYKSFIGTYIPGMLYRIFIGENIWNLFKENGAFVALNVSTNFIESYR